MKLTKIIKTSFHSILGLTIGILILTTTILILKHIKTLFNIP